MPIHAVKLHEWGTRHDKLQQGDRAMGVIEDVRKVIQDLVAPELKSLAVKLDKIDSESKLRGDLSRDVLSARIDALSAKMDAQYASIMNALDLNRRVESLEREKQSASA